MPLYLSHGIQAPQFRHCMRMEGSLVDDAVGALRDAPHLLKHADVAALLQHADASGGPWALRLVIGASFRADPTC